MKMLPLEQGEVDGLCGTYALLNALRLVVNGRISENAAINLFGTIMQHVEKRKSLGKVCTKGIVTSDVWSILKKVLCVKYKINVKRPFRKTDKISVSEFINELRKYFTQDGKRSAIISIEGNGWDHWTVVRAITKNSILLFDSAMMKKISISKCTFSKKFKRKILIIPHDTFYVYQKEK